MSRDNSAKEITRQELIKLRYNFVNRYLNKTLSTNHVARDIFYNHIFTLSSLKSEQINQLKASFKISQLIKYQLGSGFKSQISLICGDMISYCQHTRRPNWNMAVLNMANAHIPGGGFISGALAQEEQLCSRTNLYSALLVAQKLGSYPLKFGYSFIIDGVKILKNDNFKDININKNLVVISSAAKHYNSEEHAKRDKLLDDIIVQNWLSIIYSASLAGVDELVVSAIGSGAFHNPTENVATQLFNSLFLCQSGSIKKISIVIYDDHNGQRKGGNFKRFSDVFNQKCQTQDIPFLFENS